MNFNLCKAAFLLLCLLTISAQAQSGRRQVKPPPAAPVPTPTPEPTPTPKSDQQESEIGFLIAVDRGTSFMPLPLAYYDAVMGGCGDKLRSGSSARVDAAPNNMNRSEAIKRAKSETTTYVVLLKLTDDDNIGSSTVSMNADKLVLEYVVFAPRTGKVVTNGRSYQNANRKGPIVVGPTTRRSTGAIYREELLRIAGEDAGERILKAMHLNIPVLR